MDDTAVVTGGYEIFAQFKAIAVTGVGIAVLMGIGRASPPAVGIGVHLANVAHALVQGVDIGCQVVHDVRIDTARFNGRAFRIADSTEEPVRRRIRRSVGHGFSSIGSIRRRFRCNTDGVIIQAALGYILLSNGTGKTASLLVKVAK